MVLLTGLLHGGNLPAHVQATQEDQVQATVSATPTVSVTPTVLPTVTVTPTGTVTVTPNPTVTGSQEEMHESAEAKAHEHEHDDTDSENTSWNFGSQISSFVHSLHFGGQEKTTVEAHN